MGTETESKPKNKGGRPRKDKKGALLWVPDIYVDAVRGFLEGLKQQNNKQVKS